MGTVAEALLRVDFSRVSFYLKKTVEVILAGYNIDSDVIEELKKNSPVREDITPETLSASYARISRDPRRADELRAAARAEVERARRSNRTIIFEMGHHSVAEHAVFNFDILGVSRLAIEEIERFRLVSFTEKSQRYQTLTDDFVIPEEVRGAGLTDVFVDMIKVQNSLYHSLYGQLKPYIFSLHASLAIDPKKRFMLDGWAKEDARYVVSLATEAQLGMTVNARNLELMIRRLASKKLSELQEFRRKIYEVAKKVAPSILLFTEASDFDAKTYEELRERMTGLHVAQSPECREPVRLVGVTPDGDARLVAALLHSVSSASFEECLRQAKGMTEQERREWVKTSLQHMEFFDAVLREFEHVDLLYDLVVSATCFAQLKRHRMSTLTAQGYDPRLGVTIPPSVQGIGAQDMFMKVMNRTNEVFERLREKVGMGAEYVLTNAHRKRALLKVNARELYHISRLREDATAQWDIRGVAAEMSRQAKAALPLTFLLIGGKDRYPEIYREVFARSPKAHPLKN